MQLAEFRVQKFRNIVDSTAILVDEYITCLVGKNESGKTALLQALYKMKPAYTDTFNLDEHYPRWLKVREVKSGIAEQVAPITVVFELDDGDKEAVSDVLGEGVLVSTSYTQSRKYNGSTTAVFKVDEAAFIQSLLASLELPAPLQQRLRESESVDSFREAIRTAREELDEGQESSDDETRGSLDTIDHELAEKLGDSTVWQKVAHILAARVPTFFYFSEYSILPGRLDLRQLASAPSDQPASNELQTARALLELAGTDVASLSDENYEVRKAELEAVSNELTSQVFEYWTQNESLSVDIDVDKETETQPNGTVAVARNLDVRVRDQRHGYTNNFGQRSSGFQWFFSFLAAFSEFENLETGVIVLLDEPALALHGKAQADFLRFINERLAQSAQVLYTTHSPFMVEVGHLERVRIVEDQGPQRGATATQEVFGRDPDSLFPLQGALGYDIAQHLFVGPNNLVVEGTSDFTYLSVISDYLSSQKRAKLDPRWRILPTGGSSNIPAFVALIGPHLDATVLVDAGTEGMQRINNLTKSGILQGKRLITVGEIVGASNADIEDLFTVDDYLKLYNGVMGRPAITEKKLPPGDRIVKRIANLRGGDFDHRLPADYLLRHRDTVCPNLSEGTLTHFEQLIERINQTIS